MYHFYMGSVLLPIAPEKFSLKVKNANKTMTLINEGEVNFLREAGLTELEFDVLIPAVQYAFAKYEEGFKSPAYFANHFEELKVSKKPFQFIIVRKMPDGKLLFDTNMTVSMESYTVKEEAKNGFDLTVSIKLKQYRPFGTKIVKVANNTASVTEQRETANSPAPKRDETYTVKKGDCLWNIAKKFYGNGSKYTKIYEANKDKITNPNLIYPNQVLVIPAL
jgi:LysM repeat protein